MIEPLRDRVTEYAREVVAGKVVAGELHVLACKRHLDDLEKSKRVDYPYYWDLDAANAILEYAETLTILEGTAPKQLKLIPSQVFDIGATMGWRNKNTGYRRFRRRYKSVARQNGKTFENGILLSYIAGFSGYKYGKIFTVATKHAQAKLAWDEIKKFIEADKDLSDWFKIQEYKSYITCKTTACTIEALSKERSLDDGFRSIASSIDEIHQHQDNSIYKAIYNGTRALNETLVSMITTRGSKLNSFCKEMDDYCINILRGTAHAEDFFVDIYALDKDDDIFNSKNWVKSNPFLATTEKGMTILQTDANTARDMGGSDLRDFITKSLNMWVNNADDAFIDVEKWQQSGTNKTIEDFRGRSCWVGLDLSSGGDLTTIALEFEDDKKFYFYSHSFMPRGRLEEHIATDLAPYDLWENMGLITVTGGQSDYKNDYKFIIQHLKELQETYELTFSGIGYDPHNADGILSDLETFGCPLMMITQSARFLNDATVDIQLSCKSGLLEYDKSNELLTWSFTNAKTVKNSFGEVKVDKEPKARFKRIDPVDACIDAHTMLLKNREEPMVDVESEMDKYLEMMGWNK